jgi:hypothetical protein
MNEGQTIFREVQGFRQWWIWLLLLFVTGLAWYGAVQQVVLKKPFGSNPAPDAILIMIWAVFGVLFPLLFYSLRLVTEVKVDGLYIRFFPLQFHQHKISLGEIKEYEIRSYSALREYGGYGIRYGKNGKAYNVSGSRGVQFEFQDGKRLLVGSQKPEEFFSALASVMSR